MSLINKLLQDLEQRQGEGAHNEPMSAEIRSVLRPARRVGWLIPIALVLPVVAAAGLWMVISGRPAPPHVVAAPIPPIAAKPALVAAAVPAPVVAPVVAPAPVAMPAPTPPTAPVAVAVANPAPVAAPPKVEPAKAAEPAKPVKAPELASAPPPKAAPVDKPVAPARPMQADVKVVAMAGVTKKTVAVAEPPAPEAAADKPVDKPAMKVAAAEAQSQKTVSPQQLSDNMYKRAVVLVQQGRSKDARAALAESLAAAPRNAPARQLLVSLHVEGNNLSEASALLREGVKLSPDHSGLWMNLARLQLENADANGAMATLEQGLPSASDDGAYHAFYAALMQRTGRHDDAVKHYLAALRIEPGMPNWLVGIGISLQAIGKEQDAAEAFQRAKDGGQLPPAFAAFVDQRLAQLKR